MVQCGTFFVIGCNLIDSDNCPPWGSQARSICEEYMRKLLPMDTCCARLYLENDNMRNCYYVRVIFENPPM